MNDDKFMSDVTIHVSREALQTGKISPVQDIIESIIDGDDITWARRHVSFDFEGYDEDVLTLASMQDVLHWYMTLDETYPYLLYFLDPIEYSRYCAMFVPATPAPNDNIRFDRNALIAFVEDRARQVALFCARRNVSAMEALQELEASFGIDLPLDRFAAEIAMADGVPAASPAPRPHQQFPTSWSFTPEPLTARTLVETFGRGVVVWPYLDQAEEPQLYVRIDDPETAWKAPVELSLTLERTSHFPLLLLTVALLDDPEEPLELTCPLNLDDLDHRDWLTALMDVASITANLLFNGEDGRLYFAFHVPVALSDDFKDQVLALTKDAAEALGLISPEVRDFNAGVREFALRVRSQEESSAPAPRSAGRAAQTPTQVAFSQNPESTILAEALPEEDLLTKTILQPERSRSEAISRAMAQPAPAPAAPVPVRIIMHAMSPSEVDEEVRRMARRQIITENALQHERELSRQFQLEVMKLRKQLESRDASDILVEPTSWWQRITGQARQKPEEE